MDRRVRRTRRRLRDALIELVLEQGYDTITIQNITDRADLSRATFYLHYNDKDELLANSLEEMFDELVESLREPLFSDDWAASDPPPSVLAFQHVEEYAELYKALLLGDRGVAYVIYREIQYIARIVEKQLQILLQSSADEELPVPVEIAAQHMAGALFSMIVWWLENDMPHDAQYMGKMYHRMALPGVLSALGLPQKLPQSTS